MTEIIGFTGTRDPFALTGIQVGWLWDTLKAFKVAGASTFRHGDCTGGDMIAHHIADALGYSIIIHPPSDPRHRAWCTGTLLHDPIPYLDRNKVIAQHSDLLLSLPGGPEETRSGTWSTLRYNAKIGKNGYGCLPDGTLFTKEPTDA